MTFDEFIALLSEWWQRVLAALAIFSGVVLALRKFYNSIRTAQPFIDAVPKLAAIPGRIDTFAMQLSTMQLQALVTDATLRALLATEGIGFWWSDENGKCMSINPVLTEWMGLQDVEALESGWVIGIHPEDRERIRIAWEMCIKHHAPFEERYRFINSRTDAVTLCDVSARWTSGATGVKSMIVGMARRVTETAHRRLLVIEDDAGQADGIAKRFQQLGATSVIAGTFQSGITRLRTQKFDGVILDLKLPDSSAEETLDALPVMREAAGNTPLAILTGNVDRDKIEEHPNRPHANAVGLKHEVMADRETFSAFFRDIIAVRAS